MIKTFRELWQDPEHREKMLKARAELWQNPEYREKMERIYEASRLAWDRHPEISDMMSKVAEDFALLGEALSKREKGAKLNKSEEKCILAYYKECERVMPGYQKIIGEEQHKILVEWGMAEETLG